MQASGHGLSKQEQDDAERRVTYALFVLQGDVLAQAWTTLLTRFAVFGFLRARSAERFDIT
jgi:hypothetical protein